MTKRKRHAESGERVDSANHKRAKVEVPASTSDVGSFDLAKSDRPSKTSGNEHRATVEKSRKRDNSRRALKHQAKEQEQSGPKVEVPIQSKRVKNDGDEHAGGDEHKAPLSEPRNRNKERGALKRAAEQEQSGSKVEVPVENKSVQSDVQEQAGANEHKAPLSESRKRKNERRAIKYQAAEKEQSERKVEVPIQNETRKSDLHENAENVKESSNAQAKSDLPLRKEKKQRVDIPTNAQLSEKSNPSNMRQSGKGKSPRTFAQGGETSEKPLPGEVALKGGELPKVHASQNVRAGQKEMARRKARNVSAAAKNVISEDELDQNNAEVSPTNVEADEVEETRQMPITGKKRKRNKAQKQDRKAIAISESGKVPAGKDESEVMEPAERDDVQRHSSKESKSKSSKKIRSRSTDVEGVGLDKQEVMEPSKAHDVQRHSSKKTKAKSGKKGKLKSTEAEEMERSVASEGGFEQALAASYSEWIVAHSTGGQMLDTDPVFSEDEE